MLPSHQFIKYVVYGLLVNALFYGAYLLITWLGLEPKITMTITFSTGVTYSYFVHKKYTFNSSGGNSTALPRFMATVFLNYTINFFSLLIFNDILGVAHQLVQGITLIVLAFIQYNLNKHWVFKQAANPLECDSLV